MLVDDVGNIPLLYYSYHDIVSPKLHGLRATTSWTFIRRASSARTEVCRRASPLMHQAGGDADWLEALRRCSIYVLRRLLTAIPTLFVIVTIAFFLIRVAPGGPFNQERGSSPEIKANLEAQFGLDDPLWLQYVHYLEQPAARQFRAELQSARFHRRRTVRQGPADLGPARRLGARSWPCWSAARSASSPRSTRTSSATMR